MLLRLCQVEIVVVFDVCFPVNLFPVFQSRIVYVITAMEPFEQDRVIVFQQIGDQIRMFAAIYVVGQQGYVGEQPRMPLVVIYLFADGFQFGRMRTFVFETVQDDLYAAPVQGLHLIIYIDDPPVVGRPGDIESYNVQMPFHVCHLLFSRVKIRINCSACFLREKRSTISLSVSTCVYPLSCQNR